LELLASCHVGRVGTSIGALPVILPVNYTVFDHGVLLLTAGGTKLDAAARGSVVAFEADSFDPDGGAGWSVLLVGKASEIHHPILPKRAQAAPLIPWPGAKGPVHYVHIAAERISGRQFGP
jgi:nitroimidazol reductase NimA-like FMN-containing flavoprotein (pyridoxamine 5'-phosphate oxidase superfamily)